MSADKSPIPLRCRKRMGRLLNQYQGFAPIGSIPTTDSPILLRAGTYTNPHCPLEKVALVGPAVRWCIRPADAPPHRSSHRQNPWIDSVVPGGESEPSEDESRQPSGYALSPASLPPSPLTKGKKGKTFSVSGAGRRTSTELAKGAMGAAKL